MDVFLSKKFENNICAFLEAYPKFIQDAMD